MDQLRHRAVQRIGRINELDLRVDTARGIAAFCTIACLSAWWWQLSQKQPDLGLLALMSMLLPCFAVLYFLSRGRPRLGYMGVSVLCMLGVTVMSRVGTARDSLPILALPGLVLAGTFGASSGLLLGLPCALLLASLTGTATSGLLLPELILMQLCVYAVLSPKEHVLSWSWQRSAEATQLAGQLQDRQGELNRALAALRLAYQLIERTNHELALAKQEAEEARRLKEQFVTSVSHELRTPLNIVLGFTEVMHHTPAVYGLAEWPAALQQDIAEVWRSAQHLSELVDDILELARVDALNMPVIRERTQLADVINETCALAGRLLRGKPTILVVDLPEPLPPVPIDRTRIRQVLLNLLTNAMRFTDSGRIEVSAHATPDEIVVSVADTGIGIPAHEVERIFDEFAQVDGQPERGGKGLGLAIAKRFIQLHGGRIWAESQVGVGSTFYFSLPLEAKQVSRLRGGTLPPGKRADAPKLLLLHTDEFGDTLSYLSRQLDGYSVSATSLDQLTASVASEHPGAVLVAGSATACTTTIATEVAAVAQTLPAGVPVIGFSLLAPHLEAGQDLFDAVLGKPVSRDTLLQAIGRLSRGRSLLIVDDDKGFVRLAQRLLNAGPEQFDVQCAYDGAEALAKLGTYLPDVILMDIVMAPLDGYDLARAVRSNPRTAATPIIAVTGAMEVAGSARAHEFHVCKRSGLRDPELFSLLRATLAGVRADYLISAPTS